MQTPCKYAAYATPTLSPPLPPSTFFILRHLRSVAKPMKFNLTAKKKGSNQTEPPLLEASRWQIEFVTYAAYNNKSSLAPGEWEREKGVGVDADAVR